MAIKQRDLPKRVDVLYRGVPYWLNLVRCRRAFVDCQINREFESVAGLAAKLDISRSTVSRFFSGRPTSLTVMLMILDALHLHFYEVATPIFDETEVNRRIA